MCELVDLSGAAACAVSDGGIYQTQIVDGDELDDLTIDVNGQVTGITMKNVSKWVTYDYDDDNSASYNQNGERANKKITISQASFFKFAGVTEPRVRFANKIRECCKLVLIHRFNSGIALIQGIDVLSDGTWLFSKEKAKATPNILSDVGTGEDRMELNVNSVGRSFAAVVTLTQAEIEAL